MPILAATAVENAVARERLIAILRVASAAEAVRIAGDLLRAGSSIVELTMTTPGALDALASLRDRVPVLGAGTVLTGAEAAAALGAGASFLVSPVVSREVIAVARERGVWCLAGAFTPTEVLAARRAGASAVKWFPASFAGPAGLRELRAVFSDLPIVPTGGVNAGNAAAYLEAGAFAVGVGSALVGDGVGVEARARDMIEACRTS